MSRTSFEWLSGGEAETAEAKLAATVADADEPMDRFGD
jgi:hypothetical protein